MYFTWFQHLLYLNFQVKTLLLDWCTAQVIYKLPPQVQHIVLHQVSQSSEYTESTSSGDTTSLKKDIEKIGDLVNAVSTAGGFLVLTLGFAF